MYTNTKTHTHTQANTHTHTHKHRTNPIRNINKMFYRCFPYAVQQANQGIFTHVSGAALRQCVFRLDQCCGRRAMCVVVRRQSKAQWPMTTNQSLSLRGKWRCLIGCSRPVTWLTAAILPPPPHVLFVSQETVCVCGLIINPLMECWRLAIAHSTPLGVGLFIFF